MCILFFSPRTRCVERSILAICLDCDLYKSTVSTSAHTAVLFLKSWCSCQAKAELPSNLTSISSAQGKVPENNFPLLYSNQCELEVKGKAPLPVSTQKQAVHAISIISTPNPRRWTNTSVIRYMPQTRSSLLAPTNNSLTQPHGAAAAATTQPRAAT